MSEYQSPHRRRSPRLRKYDYSLSGAYFITIVTQNRSRLFGHIDAGHMKLNPAGEMVNQKLESLSSRFPTVNTDTFIIMPDHVHGILIINNPAYPRHRDDTKSRTILNVPNITKPPKIPKLGDIISAFKSKTTVEYIRGVHQHGWPPFRQRLWQRSYYDRIIRNQRELMLARRYIEENPLKWHLDRDNPDLYP